MKDLVTIIVCGSILGAPILYWTYGIIMAIKNKRLTSLVICTLMLTTCGSLYNSVIDIDDIHRQTYEPQSITSLDLSDLVDSNHIDIKSGAIVTDLDTNLINALPTIIEAYREIKGNDFTPTITSGNDSEHTTNSRHYIDKAIDLRTISDRNITMRDSRKIYKNLKEKLNSDEFNVLFESDHIHISYLK